MRNIRTIYKMQLLAVLSMVLLSSGCGSSSSNNTPADTTAPSAPTYVTAVAASTTMVSVRWTASTDNVGIQTYFIYRDGNALASTQTATTFYSDTIGTANTVYTYTVVASDAAGNISAVSSSATATTLAVGTEYGTPPTVPSNLTASASSSSTIALGWSASTDDVGVSGYNIYRAAAVNCTNATFAFVGTSTTTSYTDKGLTASTQYCYEVRAIDGWPTESLNSGQATATTTQ